MDAHCLATSNGLTGTIRTDQVSNSSSGFGTVDDIKIIVDSSGATVNTLRFQTAAGLTMVKVNIVMKCRH
jgi:hypothetical protein